eukprot:8958667-Lingulodinium_polyedra.AAC.1
MVFEKSTKLRPCGLCKDMYTHFKLMESHRAEHAYEQRACDDEKRSWRICVECEAQIRVTEFAKWSEEEKKKDPSYAEEWKVHKDLKVANKGISYSATIQHTQQAKQDIRDGK